MLLLVLIAASADTTPGPEGGAASTAPVSSAPATASSRPTKPRRTPEGYVCLGRGNTNAYYIDADGDGYGVASPKGPDADDADASVNTPASVLAKYSTLDAFLAHRGYNPQRIFYIAPDGSDATGAVGAVSRPFASWTGVASQLQAGDMVMYREGTYGANLVSLSGFHATADQPLVVMAYPGERVVSQTSGGDGAFMRYSSHVIVDGLVIESVSQGVGNGVYLYGWEGQPLHNVTLRNIESSGHGRELKAMQNLHDVLVEGCVFHHASSHNVYLGARDLPNSNLTFRNNLLYGGSSNPNFQHNGQVTNLVLEGNIIHSSESDGVGLLNGVSDSVVRNNLIFNNRKKGLVFFNYDPPAGSDCLPHPMTGNQIINNTIWVGQYGPSGDTGPAAHAAVLFNDSTTAGEGEITGTVLRNNILRTQTGPVILFEQRDFADTTTIENNLMYRDAGDIVMGYGGSIWGGGDVYGFADFEAFSPLIQNNMFASPMFASVSTEYWDTPEAFDFAPIEGSPAIGLALADAAPATDLHGTTRDGMPDAGAYERQRGPSGGNRRLLAPD